MNASNFINSVGSLIMGTVATGAMLGAGSGAAKTLKAEYEEKANSYQDIALKVLSTSAEEGISGGLQAIELLKNTGAAIATTSTVAINMTAILAAIAIGSAVAEKPELLVAIAKETALALTASEESTSSIADIIRKSLETMSLKDLSICY